MDTVLLKAENIYKTFGATKAVTDFSMEIRAGEVRGLIGENGSGKSTFSSVVAGVYNKDSGTLYVNGEEYIPHSTVEASIIPSAFFIVWGKVVIRFFSS